MTTAERELDCNTNYDWNRIQESGKDAELLFGPGYTGLANLGNRYWFFMYISMILCSILTIYCNNLLFLPLLQLLYGFNNASHVFNSSFYFKVGLSFLDYCLSSVAFIFSPTYKTPLFFRYFEKQSLKAAFATSPADPTVDLNMQM
jgi:ubiquitin carboxyl-terminal hydrolase 5/13